MTLFEMIFTPDFFFAILRITAPILFATLGAVVAEKAGVTNIGLDGIMMMSALFGSLSAYWSGSWFVGLLVAVIVGILEALLMGVFAFNLKTDIILVGIAVNMVGSGGTQFLVKVITNMTEGTGEKAPAGAVKGPENNIDQSKADGKTFSECFHIFLPNIKKT